MTIRFRLLAACLAAALSAAFGDHAGARVDPADYADYLAEMNDARAQFVVVSNHYRHDVGCTSRGCILMGPTEDRDACEDWATAYNTVDPLDHARCVEAADYDAVRY